MLFEIVERLLAHLQQLRQHEYGFVDTAFAIQLLVGLAVKLAQVGLELVAEVDAGRLPQRPAQREVAARAQRAKGLSERLSAAAERNRVAQRLLRSPSSNILSMRFR